MGLETNDSSQSSNPDSMHEFGLDERGDRWLAHLREAENADPLISVGCYDLISEVGRGGQGIVYRARERATRRTVAIKRLLGGSSSSPHSRRRLERELETASALDHAGIVNVLGIDVADGQPLLAMQWISGVPITAWAAGAAGGPRRSPSQVVDMALEVCDAMQHAHQRGVIHRDLKPSNILVDVSNHPHILDFGLAKFADPALAPPQSELTVGEQFLGTLAYASPEHLARRGDALAHSIDVRSDLYQFGLVLYELLTGRMPYPVASSPTDALAQREDAVVARPSSLNASVDRDLDLIVLKAIAMNPADRYQSADALNADLAHFRAGEPITARAPGTGYLLRKVLRRHRAAVTFMATVLLLVVIGGTVATVLAVRLAASRAQEHRAREIAEETNAFLNTMLSSADPSHSGGEVTARELLDQAAQRLDQQFADQPQVNAALRETIGRAYLGLGLYDAAEKHLQMAAAAREGQAGDNAGLAVALSGLAELRYAQRRLPEAEQFSRRAMGLLEKQTPKDESAIARELNNLGAIRRAQDDLDQAEALLRRALEIRRRLPGEHDEEIAETLNNLGNVLRLRKDLPGAESLCREVLAIRQRRLGPKHPLLAQSLDNLGIVLSGQGRIEEARHYSQQALAMYRDVFGPDHPDVGISAGNLGRILVQALQFEDAEPLLRESLRIREASFPPTDRRTSSLRMTLGSCLLRLGRPHEAQPLLLHELAQRQSMAPNEPVPQDLLASLVELYEQLELPVEAERYESLRKNQ